MKTIYQAWDGKQFANMNDCIKYERENEPYHIWDENGSCDYDHALVAYFPNDKSMYDFRKECEMECIPIRGLTCPGWYIWNRGEWIRFNQNTIQACIHAKDFIEEKEK